MIWHSEMLLVTNIPSGASNAREKHLFILIGKCATNQAAFQDVGGE